LWMADPTLSFVGVAIGHNLSSALLRGTMPLIATFLPWVTPVNVQSKLHARTANNKRFWALNMHAILEQLTRNDCRSETLSILCRSIPSRDHTSLCSRNSSRVLI
jgi:hypothetical protein